MSLVGKGKSLRFKKIVSDLNYWGVKVVAGAPVRKPV